MVSLVITRKHELIKALIKLKKKKIKETCYLMAYKYKI